MKALITVVAVIGLIAIVAASAAESRPSISDADSTHTVREAFGDSSPLGKTLDRSCGDCHSNAMVPGWYTRVAPFSGIMKRAAREGRKAVNFAEWSGYSPQQQRAYLIASCAAVKAGKMPMGSYLRLREDAKLSAADIETICGAAR